MTLPSVPYGPSRLAAEESRRVAASEIAPVVLEVLGGTVDTDTHGELGAGEKVDLTAPTTITALVDSTIHVDDQDEEE